MPRQVNIAEAKAKLSELVEAASRGEEIVLARHGKPMARLSPVASARPKIRLGVLKSMLSQQDIDALVQAIERPLSKSDAAAMRGEHSDRFGITKKALRGGRKRSAGKKRAVA